MTQFKRSLALILLLTATAAGAAACAGKTIQHVLADPARYRDREVTISGNVVDSYSFAGQGAYHLEDRTGGLWVVSQTRGAAQGCAGEDDGHDPRGRQPRRAQQHRQAPERRRDSGRARTSSAVKIDRRAKARRLLTAAPVIGGVTRYRCQ